MEILDLGVSDCIPKSHSMDVLTHEIQEGKLLIKQVELQSWKPRGYSRVGRYRPYIQNMRRFPEASLIRTMIPILAC